MMGIMDWNKCEKGLIRKVEPDTERVKSIVEKAMQRLRIIEDMILSPETASFIVEGYYEVIKELLVAYMLVNGLRSKNHQCLISFFYKKNPELEHEAMLISRMSYYRNRLDYYGETIPTSFYEENKKDINDLINKLKGLLENETQ